MMEWNGEDSHGDGNEDRKELEMKAMDGGYDDPEMYLCSNISTFYYARIY